MYYRAGVITFQAARDRSLARILRDTVDACEPLGLELTRLAIKHKREIQDTFASFHAMMLEIHRTATASRRQETKSECATLRAPDEKRRAFGSVRSPFEEFVRVFQLVFVFQRGKLNEQVASIAVAVHELERMDAQVHSQLALEVDSETQLRAAARAVIENAEALREREAMEREAKRAFLLDEQRCAVLQSEIEREREVIQLELAKTLPDLLQATESLAQINKYHITEMKSFTNPPQLVRLVMQAVCVLLGSSPTWTEALRILADIRFIERLRSFDRDHVDPALIERVKLFINHPDFSMDNMKRASLASTTLCKWVLAIVRYFEVMKHVAPTQEKLERTERSFQIIDELVQRERKKLIDLELEINVLRAAYAKSAQFEEELQRSHDARVKWRSAVSNFADVLTTWQDAVAKTHHALQAQQDDLIEHCAVVAALMVYAIGQAAAERDELVREWTRSIRSHIGSKYDCSSPTGVDSSTDELPPAVLADVLTHWTLSGHVMMQELKHALVTMQFADKPSVVTNLFLTDQTQKVCLRYPLLFDPLHFASAWLRDRFVLSGSTYSASMATIAEDMTAAQASSASNASQREEQTAAAGPTLLLVLDAGDPLLMSTIEKQVTQKTSPLVRSVAWTIKATVRRRRRLLPWKE